MPFGYRTRRKFKVRLERGVIDTNLQLLHPARTNTGRVGRPAWYDERFEDQHSGAGQNTVAEYLRDRLDGRIPTGETTPMRAPSAPSAIKSSRPDAAAARGHRLRLAALVAEPVASAPTRSSRRGW